MKIAVFGLGYVGLTTAACLTADGHTVFGVDVNESKVRDANAGVSPITEPGVEDLLKAAVQQKLLRCTSDCASVLDECGVAIVCVGTPSLPEGAHNMSFVARVTRQIAETLKTRDGDPLTVIYRSTMRPGTMDEMIRPIFESVLGQENESFELVYNPEFLRESSAIEDYFNPPKIVVGTRNGRPNATLEAINKKIKARTFHTYYREAELTKFVDNSFHALKVAFANEIGRISMKLGVSIKTVHEIFVSDTKLNISAKYLRPGGAFGGSCLPKDVRALQYLSSEIGANTQLVDSLLRTNDAHKHFLFEQVVQGLSPRAKILMLGLAFKRESDDLRESPKVDLARKILNAGYNLSIYDPWVKEEQLVGQNLGYTYMQLPMLSRLLVSRDQVESTQYDLIIDSSGLAPELAVSAIKFINVNSFA